MQIILNGLISGCAIALLAVAFQIVYLPTRVFFIGLAGLYSLTPYGVLAASNAGLPIAAGVAIALTVVVLLAILCEWLNHAPLARKNASEGVHLVSSLGIYIIFVQVIAIVWGNDTKAFRTGLDSTLHVAGTVLTGAQLLMAGTASVFLIGAWAILRTSDIGLRLRALADNPTRFALFGYNVDAYRLIAFALAGTFAAVSSMLTAYDIGFDPYTGLHAVLLAVVAVIVGGRHSFIGPAVGGLLLGFVRAQVVWHFSARWQEAVTFAMLALFLLLRPQGLFGRQTRIEATA
jgi:branched-chain amino acid transport system permease protein